MSRRPRAIWLNEATANELERLLWEETNRLRDERRLLSESGRKRTIEYVNTSSSLRQVRRMKEQLNAVLKDYDWGERGNRALGDPGTAAISASQAPTHIQA